MSDEELKKSIWNELAGSSSQGAIMKVYQIVDDALTKKDAEHRTLVEAVREIESVANMFPASTPAIKLVRVLNALSKAVALLPQDSETGTGVR